MFRTGRALVYPVLTAVAITVGITVVASPASAENLRLTPSTWAYIDSQAPRTSFVNPPGDAPIGTRIEADGKSHTYRSYFTFDLGPLRGQAVHVGQFSAAEAAVTDCTARPSIQLWRTRPIRSNTSWRNPPAELERIGTYLAGGSRCPGGVAYSMVAALNAALARGDTAMTVELRVVEGQETQPALSRSVRTPSIALSTNYLPVVSELRLAYPDRPCGTLFRPTPATDYTVFRAKATDPEGDHARVVFSVWPAGRPDERREFSGGADAEGNSEATADLSAYPNGSLVAWAGRGDDHRDLSPWSKPCYLRIDRTPPATAPIVASHTYPQGTTPSGGPGVKGRFWFTANGDRDVVAYSYTDIHGSVPHERVAARWPGGPALIEYTPRQAGEQYLDVTPEDAAGNRGPTTRYRFTVRATAPNGSVDVAGVGLPSRITLQAVPEVTGFGYQLPGAAEVRFPATNGVGSTDIIFPATGSYEITTRSYVRNRMIGSDRLFVNVDDAPTVRSAEFNLERTPVAGQSGTFTFTPRTTNVVAYLYSFNGGGQERVEAAADGTAALPWTAPAGGWYSLLVQSVRADGALSQAAWHQFNVIDPRPVVYVPDITGYPRRDGPGIPLEIHMMSALPNVTAFAYRVNGGAEQTATLMYPGFALVSWTPDRAGNNTVVVQGLLADGSRSPETEFTFPVWSGPVVTWSPAGSGVVDKPVTFTFRQSLPGVAEYRYRLPGMDEQTVPAGADGTATVTYVPRGWGAHQILVRSVGGDGTDSDTREFYYDVRDNKVWVIRADLDENSPRSGIGNTAFFQLYTQRVGEVVEYRYRVDDEPEQAIPAVRDGTTTLLSITLLRNGLNTLYVRGSTADGELSPVTEYRFLVGTAPHVFSVEYPEGTWGGGAGVAGTFEFGGGTPGIVSFDYQVDGGEVTTVAADAQGRASVVYTPTGDNWFHAMVVTGRLADGSTTDQRSYYFQVRPG
jgi:hypothetical protein